MAALSSFIVTRNDQYGHDCKDRAAVTRWRRPWIRVPRRNNVALCGFCGQKVWQQRISTKKCCPCTVNIVCHVKQSINWVQKFSEGRTRRRTSSRSAGWDRHVGNVAARRRHHPSRQEGHHRRMEITLKNKCCLCVIIPIRFFSTTICNLLINFPSYVHC